MATASATAAAAIPIRPRRGGAGIASILTDDDAPVFDTASSAKARSRAEWKRSSRFFSRQRRTMRSNAGEAPLAAATISGGSSRRIALIVSTAVLPLKARFPENIS